MVTEVRPLDKKRRLIIFEDGDFVPLYLGELHRYHIEEGGSVSETVFFQLLETLRKRARLRCMHLLQKADKTEAQLKQKLKEGHYPPFLIEDAIGYVRGFGYTDDERYARQYVEQHGVKKSKRRLKQDLLQRGISPELVLKILEEDLIDEERSLRMLAEKKIASVKPRDRAGWQKVYRYLVGKGYGYQQISRVIGQLSQE